jgi:hypothetical protein
MKATYNPPELDVARAARDPEYLKQWQAAANAESKRFIKEAEAERHEYTKSLLERERNLYESMRNDGFDNIFEELTGETANEFTSRVQSNKGTTVTGDGNSVKTTYIDESEIIDIEV